MLKRVFRLTKHGSFSYVYRRGENKASSAFSLFYVGSASFKVGFSVSNKLGKACIRNKLKRRMREAVKRLLPLPKYQIVIVARQRAVEMSYKEICEEIERLLKKAGLIDAKTED